MGITLNGVSITADASVFRSGKGMLIASGTTDTYLSAGRGGSFQQRLGGGDWIGELPLCLTLNNFVWGHALHCLSAYVFRGLGGVVASRIGSCSKGGFG